MENHMTVFMWIALIGAVGVAFKFIPEMLVVLLDRAGRIREYRGGLTPVPAHTVRRLSQRRLRR